MNHNPHVAMLISQLTEGAARDYSPCPGTNAMASYIDGFAKSKERKRLELHYASCMECRRDLLELRRILSMPLEHHEATAVIGVFTPKEHQYDHHRHNS